MSDLPITRGEFNAAITAVRDQVAGVEARMTDKFSEMREDQAERFSRVEAFQEMASASALRDAKESGKLEQRVESLEESRRLWDSEQKDRDAANRNQAARLYVGLALAAASGFLALILRSLGG